MHEDSCGSRCHFLREREGEMNAPDIALLFIDLALEMGPRAEKAKTTVFLAQTLVALRRLDEAWSAAL